MKPPARGQLVVKPQNKERPGREDRQLPKLWADLLDKSVDRLEKRSPFSPLFRRNYFFRTSAASLRRRAPAFPRGRPAAHYHVSTRAHRDRESARNHQVSRLVDVINGVARVSRGSITPRSTTRRSTAGFETKETLQHVFAEDVAAPDYRIDIAPVTLDLSPRHTLKTTGRQPHRRPRSIRRAKSEMLNERVKIAIAIQQREFLLDATRRVQRIHGLPNRYPEGPQFAEVPGRLKCDGFADERDQRHRSQQFTGLIEIAVAYESL